MAKLRSGRGQALVEFALALPLLVVFLVGLFDLGRAVYTSNTIANAARIGNRLAIVDQNPTAIKNAAKQEAVWVGLDDDDIDIAFCSEVKIGCLATVTVTTVYDPSMPVIGGLIGPITMTTDSEMPIERVYQSP